MADSNYAVQFTLAATLAAGFSGSFKKATGMLKGLSEETKALKVAQKQLYAQVKEVQASMRDYAVPVAEAKKQLHELSREQLKNYGAQISASKKGIMEGASKVMVGVGMANMFAQPIKDAMEFESAMADVRKVVDGLDDTSAFQSMSEDILKLSTEIPMTAEGIASIVAAGGQSGIAKDELLGFATDAAKMGIAFDITAEQAGDMMAKWRTAFKMGQSDVNDLADKINYLGNTTAASAPLISDVVTRIGPLGDVGGVASGEIAALGASIVGVGVPSEVAATGIKNLILGLTAGEEASDTQANAFAKLGFSASDMAKRMQTDAKGAILDVMKALKSLDPSEQAATLKALFGKESIGAIAPLLSNLEALEGNLDKVAKKSNYAGSMEAEYASRCETAQNATQLFQNSMKYTSITMGNAFLPILKWVAKELIGFVGCVGSFVKEHPAIVATIGGFIGGLIALQIVAGAFQIVMNSVNIVIAIYRGAMAIATFFTSSQTFALIAQKVAMIATRIAYVGYLGVLLVLRGAMAIATAAQWAFNAALLANPVGLVIIAIVALIAIAYLLISNWETVKAWFATMWEGAITALSNFGQYVTDKLNELCGWVKEKWEGVKSFLSNPLTAVVNYVSGGEVPKGATVPAEDAPAFAVGGVVTRPTMAWIGEGGDEEYIIPINTSVRARSLWQAAGEKLGMLKPSQGGANTQSFAHKANSLRASMARSASNVTDNSQAQIVYAPNITVTGGADERTMRRALSAGFNDFTNMMDKWKHQQRRVAFD